VNVDENKLAGLFAPFGKTTSVVIMRAEDGASKGFGFINFEKYEEAKSAVEDMNGKVIDNKPLYVARAQKKSERESELRDRFEKLKQERIGKYQGVNLYVKNLDDTIDDEKLREAFAVYGSITSVKVMRDEKDNSKGFGFVCYHSPDEATKAVTEMNSRMIGTKPIYVALAQRKEVRRAQLEAQHRQNGMRIQQAGGGMPGQFMAPVFYPNVPTQRGFGMYPPQQMVPRASWVGRPPQTGRGYPQMSNNYPVPVRTQRGRSRNMGTQRGGQSVGANARRQGFKINSGTVNTRGNQQQTHNNNVNKGNTGVIAEPLTATALAAATPEAQKQIIGERLFPLIRDLQGELAGKITGMLLELDTTELLNLLENPESLNIKINEAVQVLQNNPDAKSADAV